MDVPRALKLRGYGLRGNRLVVAAQCISARPGTNKYSGRGDSPPGRNPPGRIAPLPPNCSGPGPLAGISSTGCEGFRMVRGLEAWAPCRAGEVCAAGKVETPAPGFSPALEFLYFCRRSLEGNSRKVGARGGCAALSPRERTCEKIKTAHAKAQRRKEPQRLSVFFALRPLRLCDFA